MGVKDIMKAYFFKVRFDYGVGAYAVAASSVSTAEQMLDAWFKTYDWYGCEEKDIKISMIGMSDNFATVNGEIAEGEVVELALYIE